jgi:hypothetical protein
VLREIGEHPIPRKAPALTFEARTVKATLKTYYQRKFRLYRVGDLSFAVKDLKTIFRVSQAAAPAHPASAFIRRHKRLLVESVGTWSGQRAGEVGRVVARLAKLADEHNLAMRDSAQETLAHLSSYVSTLVLYRLRTHRYGTHRA